MGSIVFRDYDAVELERQFNPRTYTADFEAIAQFGLLMSANYRNRARNTHFDIAYGSSPREVLDLFLPNAPNGAPVEMYIHGGFWRSREKTNFSYIAEPVVEAGGIVAIVEYDLCPNVTLDIIVQQMRNCTIWIHENISDFGGDPNQLHITGHSAGGHLAAMLLATNWTELGLPTDILKSIFPISGVFEVAPVMHTSVQEMVRLTPEISERNSPIYLPAQSAPAVAVAVGTLESEEFRRQSKAYADELSNQGLTVEHLEMPDQNHYSILTESVEPGNQLTATRLKLLGLA